MFGQLCEYYVPDEELVPVVVVLVVAAKDANPKERNVARAKTAMTATIIRLRLLGKEPAIPEFEFEGPICISILTTLIVASVIEC